MFIPAEKAFYFCFWHDRINNVTDFLVSGILLCKFVTELWHY